MTTEPVAAEPAGARRGSRVVLHAGHAARRAPRSPRVYVYELAEHSTLVLQLRAASCACAV